MNFFLPSCHYLIFAPYFVFLCTDCPCCATTTSMLSIGSPLKFHFALVEEFWKLNGEFSMVKTTNKNSERNQMHYKFHSFDQIKCNRLLTTVTFSTCKLSSWSFTGSRLLFGSPCAAVCESSCWFSLWKTRLTTPNRSCVLAPPTPLNPHLFLPPRRHVCICVCVCFQDTCASVTVGGQRRLLRAEEEEGTERRL